MEKIFRYYWEGISSNGMKISNTCLSNSRMELQQTLKQQSIYPIIINKKLNFINSPKIKFQDVTNFCHELSLLLVSGIPILQSLQIIADTINNKRLNEIICYIKTEVQKGKTLSDLLRKFPDVFDDLLCNMVLLAEQTGNYDKILTQIVEQRQKLAALKKKIMKALYYPFFVCGFSAVIIMAMLVFVIPQFQMLYSTMGAELPLLTKIIIFISKQITSHISLIISSIAAGYISLTIAIKSRRNFKKILDKFTLLIPVLGKVIYLALFARSFRVLALTIEAGLPLIDSLKIVIRVVNNQVFSENFYLLLQNVRMGKSVVASMENKFFPNRVKQMIAIAEETGRLEEICFNLAEYYEQKFDAALYFIQQMIEPVLMIFLSGVIGGLVIAMYLPIFRIGAIV